jgi:hypothetical protein
MPSPQFSFRLPAADKAALLEMAKIYGAPSPGAFCAEMIGVMCSGDLERVKAFNGRLIAKAGEQLTLKLNAAMDAADAVKPKKSPVKRRTHTKATPRAR